MARAHAEAVAGEGAGVSQWGEPHESWLTTLVQFAAFAVLFIVIIFGMTAVT